MHILFISCSFLSFYSYLSSGDEPGDIFNKHLAKGARIKYALCVVHTGKTKLSKRPLAPNIVSVCFGIMFRF